MIWVLNPRPTARQFGSLQHEITNCGLGLGTSNALRIDVTSKESCNSTVRFEKPRLALAVINYQVCHVFLLFICRFVGGLLESGDGAWIGLNDRSKESRYLWNYNKFDTPRYFAWDETNPSNTEPNNFNGQCNVESCVEMKTTNKKWNDAVCIAHRNFVCERESIKGEYWHVIYHR